MLPLKAALIIGTILRPLQLMVVSYLFIIQARELRRRTPYQPIKRLLLALFGVNMVLYSFSLFIDLVGLFGWFQALGIYFLIAYLLVNSLSGTAVSILLLIIYRARIKE